MFTLLRVLFLAVLAAGFLASCGEATTDAAEHQVAGLCCGGACETPEGYCCGMGCCPDLPTWTAGAEAPGEEALPAVGGTGGDEES